MSNKKKSKSNNNLRIKFVVILFIILMFFLVYTKYKNDNDQTLLASAKTSVLFDSVKTNVSVDVTKFIVYGTHLNIEGNVSLPQISGINIDNVDIVLKNIDNEEVIIDSEYTYSDNLLSFSTIENLNTGIDLENLSTCKYYIFLKTTFSNNEINYYSLSNNTEYNDITYYTLTKNTSNNKIDVYFDKYNSTSYMCINVSKAKELPENVYDVVIDPGHGGSDSGAKSDGYYESNIVLDCAFKLKSKLEDLGLKVLLTRNGSEGETQDMVYNIYDDDGRVTISNESNAKILLSLHMNSNSQNVKEGGVEVYAPGICDLTFAKSLADNIVKSANTSYSKLNIYKKFDGVYVHNFNNAEILAFKTKAENDGYEPYNLTNDTPYLYMIREIGGICTNAFVDGRNSSYSANKYVNSNVGIEGYLIELGYMIIDKDLKNILLNSDDYMQGIANSIESFYRLSDNTSN